MSSFNTWLQCINQMELLSMERCKRCQHKLLGVLLVANDQWLVFKKVVLLLDQPNQLQMRFICYYTKHSVLFVFFHVNTNTVII